MNSSKSKDKEVKQEIVNVEKDQLKILASLLIDKVFEDLKKGNLVAKNSTS